MKLIRGIAIAGVMIVPIACQFYNGTVKAQTETRTEIGTVDGKPIFDKNMDARAVSYFVLSHHREPATAADNQEVAASAAKSRCDDIKRQLLNAARETQKRHFAITVTPDEVAAASKAYFATHDPAADLREYQQRQVAYSTAASLVYDQGQDPQKVYQTVILPIDSSPVSQSVWQANLVRWRDPEVRKKLAQQAANASKVTASGLRESFDKTNLDLLESQKLDAEVDTQLAAADPQFRAYLNEFKPRGQGNAVSGLVDHMNYVTAKRNDFWQARYSEQQVRLNDSSLSSQCNLGAAPLRPLLPR